MAFLGQCPIQKTDAIFWVSWWKLLFGFFQLLNYPVIDFPPRLQRSICFKEHVPFAETKASSLSESFVTSWAFKTFYLITRLGTHGLSNHEEFLSLRPFHFLLLCFWIRPRRKFFRKKMKYYSWEGCSQGSWGDNPTQIWLLVCPQLFCLPSIFLLGNSSPCLVVCHSHNDFPWELGISAGLHNHMPFSLIQQCILWWASNSNQAIQSFWSCWCGLGRKRVSPPDDCKNKEPFWSEDDNLCYQVQKTYIRKREAVPKNEDGAIAF